MALILLFRYQETVPRDRMAKRDSFRGSHDRGQRYPQPEEPRDRRQGSYRKQRMHPDRPEMNRIPREVSRPPRDNRSAVYPRENLDYQYPPPADRGYGREISGYYPPPPYDNRYPDPYQPPMTHREHISKTTGRQMESSHNDCRYPHGLHQVRCSNKARSRVPSKAFRDQISLLCYLYELSQFLCHRS